MTTTVAVPDDYALFAGSGARGDDVRFFSLELVRPAAGDDSHNLFAPGWHRRPSLYVATTADLGRRRVALWVAMHPASASPLDRRCVGTLVADEVASSDLDALCAAVAGGADQAWLPLLDWLLEHAPAEWQPHLAQFAGRPFGGRLRGEALYG